MTCRLVVLHNMIEGNLCTRLTVRFIKSNLLGGKTKIKKHWKTEITMGRQGQRRHRESGMEWIGMC